MTFDAIFSSLPAGGWTAGALIALGVLMLMTGQVIPKHIYSQAIRDRDYWREAAEENRDTVAEQQKMIAELHSNAAQLLAEHQAQAKLLDQIGRRES